MSRDLIAGIDVGTQSTKAVVWQLDGQAVAEASSGYEMSFPQPTWAEQSPSDWIEAVDEVLREIFAGSSSLASDVACLGISSQLDGVVPVDEDGRPLRDAIIWMDRRARAECEEIASRVPSPEVLQRTGKNIDSSHGAPKILWIKRHQPNIYENAHKFLPPGGVVLHHLTRRFAVDGSNASSMMLLDVKRREWDRSLVESLGLDPGKLPEVLPGTSIVGQLERSYLSESIPVAVGGGDDPLAIVGSGVTEPGEVCDIVGTAEPVGGVLEDVVFDETGLLETHCHADPDRWLLENPGFVSGGNYRWFRDEFGGAFEPTAEGGDIYRRMNRSAKEVPAGSEGLIFLPCMMGAMTPEWNSSARGVFYGMTLKHSRGHFVRALLEGSAYALNDLVRRMGELDIPVESISVVGGGSKGNLWRQIKADVTGVPIVKPHIDEASCFGAAVIAGIGVDLFDSVEEACGRMLRVEFRNQPDADRHRRYREYYELYRSLYDHLKPVFDRSAQLTDQGAERNH